MLNNQKYRVRNNPKTIYDVGANTGKFAISGSKYSDSVSIKMIDLPGQLKIARGNVAAAGHTIIAIISLSHCHQRSALDTHCNSR